MKVGQEPNSSANEVRSAEISSEAEKKLTANVRTLTETSDQMLRRVLMSDEKVKAQFDCFYPEEYVPRWKIVVLVIATFGFYAFVLLHFYIQRWCKRMFTSCCKVVQLEKGKLVVTDKGRIICWSETLLQTDSGCTCNSCNCGCEACGPPVNYTTQMRTSVYSAAKISQITQIYENSNLFCCCYNDYDVKVEIAFEQYIPFSNSLISAGSKWAFFGGIQTILDTGLASIESALGVSRNPTTLYVVSGSNDESRSKDLSEVLQELAGLYHSIIQALPAAQMPNVFLNESGDSEGGLPVIVNKLGDVTVVDSNGKITIPSKWLSLLNDEQIITSHGEVYRIHCSDMLLTAATLGLYYLFVIRPKRSLRYGIVLTTKRVIVMTILHPSGDIPADGKDFNCTLQSFFPGSVASGFYSSFSGGTACFKEINFTCGILCQTGMLAFKFEHSEDKGLAFAKCLQMSVKRKNTASKYTTENPTPVGLDKMDMDLIPLLRGERILGKVEGEPIPVPFCNISGITNCLKQFPVLNNISLPDYCCSVECLGRRIFPCVPRILTCGYYPFDLKKDMLITDYSLVTYVRKSRSCLCSACNSVKDYGVVWFTNESLLGHSLSVENGGHENFYSRCCKNNCFGRNFCPISTNTFNLMIQMEKQTKFTLSHSQVNKNWLTDATLLNNVRLIDNVQNSHHISGHGLDPNKSAIRSPNQVGNHVGGVASFGIDRS